ncbi:MAG: SDR family oxidoreductase [Flavobacteriaceae bacterium]|jgi:NAD(P)-dependent dehydrogenase (short-subunit alcohol dehydrogenase family)|nr:SDR family oxidoreductase [Flavobacteriaceae bacterium]MBT3920662.1 SDR family oxidoreductase [Flavobacteriaceae bacterium]MBT6705802.1 SDR family oxidoreductase [Flavobacteriaceae bacterium]MBT7243385.1 SDR family oxidoreductase [Flavobacteriaceae bacterium]
MKNVIITGTSRGIGYELVPLFTDAGYNVLALSRNSAPISSINLDGCTMFPFDITDSKDILMVSQFVKENWKQVDILINNSGALINKPFAKTSIDDFLSVYEVNVFGAAALTKAVLPFMKKDGHVVNISSMGGVQGSVKFPGLSAYSSSKGALIALTELLAEEYKETGPSFNALALGAVQTEMLEEAFPGFNATVSAEEMAKYIMQFSLSGHQMYNGKVLQVSNSTP